MKFRTKLATLVLGAMAAFSSIAQAQTQAANRSEKVLIVVSSNGADGGKTRPGFEMDELTQAYAVFADNGLSVDVASPRGASPVADEFDPDKPYNKRFLADRAAKQKLDGALALSAVRDKDYAAIFVIGGKGAMFDLPIDLDLKHLLVRTYQAGGVIAAVCHGPAVLINLPLPDGKALVAGRSVTGFSNEEEALFGKRWAAAFPVLLEDGLRGAGARFSEAPMMLEHVVADGRIVTGQNPYSTSGAAEASIRAMGRQVAKRERFPDEQSIAMIASVLAGQGKQAQAELAKDPARYDVALLAAWGHYRAMTPGADRATLAMAIEIMEMAAPHYKEPQLGEAIARARKKLSSLR